MSRGRGERPGAPPLEPMRVALRLSRAAMDGIAGQDLTSLRRATTAALGELNREDRRTMVAGLALLVATLAAHVPDDERERVFRDATVGGGLGPWLRLVLEQSSTVIEGAGRR